VRNVQDLHAGSWSWTRSGKRWLAALLSLLVGLAGLAIVDVVGAQTASVTVIDETPQSGVWHKWWGIDPDFTSGSMKVIGTVERNAANAVLVPGSYVLELSGSSPGSAAVSPYLESHTNWNTKVTPIESTGTQGQLAPKPFTPTAGVVSWPFTIAAGSTVNTQINVRLHGTTDFFVSRFVIRPQTTTATTTTVPVGSGSGTGSVELFSETPTNTVWNSWWGGTVTFTGTQMTASVGTERAAKTIDLGPGSYVLEIAGPTGSTVNLTPYFETHSNWQQYAGPVEAAGRNKGELTPKPFQGTVVQWPVTIAAGVAPSTHLDLRLVGSGPFTINRVTLRKLVAPSTTTTAPHVPVTGPTHSEIPTADQWHGWWTPQGATFVSGVSMKVNTSAERNAFAYTMAPGAFEFVVEGTGPGTVTPYVATHNNWNQITSPVEAQGRPHGQLEAKPVPGTATWPVTIPVGSPTNPQVNLRLVTTNEFTITQVTLRPATASTTTTIAPPTSVPPTVQGAWLPVASLGFEDSSLTGWTGGYGGAAAVSIVSTARTGTKAVSGTNGGYTVGVAADPIGTVYRVSAWVLPGAQLWNFGLGGVTADNNVVTTSLVGPGEPVETVGEWNRYEATIVKTDLVTSVRVMFSAGAAAIVDDVVVEKQPGTGGLTTVDEFTFETSAAGWVQAQAPGTAASTVTGGRTGKAATVSTGHLRHRVDGLTSANGAITVSLWVKAVGWPSLAVTPRNSAGVVGPTQRSMPAAADVAGWRNYVVSIVLPMGTTDLDVVVEAADGALVDDVTIKSTSAASSGTGPGGSTTQVTIGDSFEGVRPVRPAGSTVEASAIVVLSNTAIPWQGQTELTVYVLSPTKTKMRASVYVDGALASSKGIAPSDTGWIKLRGGFVAGTVSTSIKFESVEEFYVDSVQLSTAGGVSPIAYQPGFDITIPTRWPRITQSPVCEPNQTSTSEIPCVPPSTTTTSTTTTAVAATTVPAFLNPGSDGSTRTPNWLPDPTFGSDSISRWADPAASGVAPVIPTIPPTTAAPDPTNPPPPTTEPDICGYGFLCSLGESMESPTSQNPHNCHQFAGEDPIQQPDNSWKTYLKPLNKSHVPVSESRGYGNGSLRISTRPGETTGVMCAIWQGNPPGYPSYPDGTQISSVWAKAAPGTTVTVELVQMIGRYDTNTTPTVQSHSVNRKGLQISDRWTRIELWADLSAPPNWHYQPNHQLQIRLNTPGTIYLDEGFTTGPRTNSSCHDLPNCGGTTTPPPTPPPFVGSRFTDGEEALVKSPDGSVCLTTDVHEVAIWESSPEFCHSWIPQLLPSGVGLASGYILRSGSEYRKCLSGTTLAICSRSAQTQRFDDRQIDGTSFLLAINGGNTCLARAYSNSIELRACSATDETQHWTDPPSSTSTTLVNPKKRSAPVLAPAPPLAPLPLPPLVNIQPSQPPPGATPYYQIPKGKPAAGGLFAAGVLYAFWEWQHVPKGDDFEFNYGSIQDPTKSINRVRLRPGRQCADLLAYQIQHFGRALEIMEKEWRHFHSGKTPRENNSTVLVGYFCLDGLVGPIWALSGSNGGLNLYPQSNNYRQPGLFEHSREFGESLIDRGNIRHAEMNAIGRLVDEDALLPDSKGFVFLSMANEEGYICVKCQEQLAALAKLFPGVYFDVKARKFGKLPRHSWRGQAEEWEFEVDNKLVSRST
jgi:hypothetical protein